MVGLPLKDTLTRSDIYRFNQMFELRYPMEDDAFGKECHALVESYIGQFDALSFYLPSLSAEKLDHLLEQCEVQVVGKIFGLEHTDQNTLNDAIERTRAPVFEGYLKQYSKVFTTTAGAPAARDTPTDQLELNMGEYARERNNLQQKFLELGGDSSELEAFDRIYKQMLIASVGNELLDAHEAALKTPSKHYNLLNGRALKALSERLVSIGLESDSPFEAQAAHFANLYLEHARNYMAKSPLVMERFLDFEQQEFDRIVREIYKQPDATDEALHTRIAQQVSRVYGSPFMQLMVGEGFVTEDGSLNYTRYAKERDSLAEHYTKSGQGRMKDVEDFEQFMQYRSFILVHQGVNHEVQNEIAAIAEQAKEAKGKGGGRG